MWTDGLFTNWRFGFDFDPRLHDLKLLVLDLFYNLYSSSLWRTDTIVVSKLNKPPPPASNKLETNKPPPGGRLNTGFTVSKKQSTDGEKEVELQT